MLLGEHVLFDRFCLSLHLPPLLADWFLLLLKTLASYIWLWHTAPRRGLQAYQGGCLDGSGFCCVSWDCAAKWGRVVLAVNPCEGRRSGVCLWDGILLQQPRPIQHRSFEEQHTSRQLGSGVAQCCWPWLLPAWGPAAVARSQPASAGCALLVKYKVRHRTENWI